MNKSAIITGNFLAFVFCVDLKNFPSRIRIHSPAFHEKKNNMVNFYCSENVAAWDTNFLIITGICLPAHSWHHHGRCPPLWLHLHPALLRPQLHLVLADILHVSHQHSSSYIFITFAELLKNGGLERTVPVPTYVSELLYEFGSATVLYVSTIHSSCFCCG